MVTLIAITLAMKPPTAEKSFGSYRSEVLAALFEGAALVAVDSYILFEAYHRLLRPKAFEPNLW
jgi:cobalt-zinc-cadmium efflux system protein